MNIVKLQDEGAEASELAQTERKVIEVLNAELPQTVSIMNAPAICERAELGEFAQHIEDDEQLPEQETYERYQRACSALVNRGQLVEAGLPGLKAYRLSDSAIKTSS